jgi:hypothetical protein
MGVRLSALPVAIRLGGAQASIYIYTFKNTYTYTYTYFINIYTDVAWAPPSLIATGRAESLTPICPCPSCLVTQFWPGKMKVLSIEISNVA